MAKPWSSCRKSSAFNPGVPWPITIADFPIFFLEQYAAARRDFDQAAELDPDFAAKYYKRGLAKWHLQD